VGRGATFTIRLPILTSARPVDRLPGTVERRTTPRERRARLAGSPRPEPERLDGLHVLVVDDDADGRALTALVLTDAGARVSAAMSAREARQMLSAQPPDVLVSDIGMPGEDGYALIRDIREYERAHGGCLPVIALTGYAGDDERIRILAAGFQAHVPKPLDPAELTAAIARVTRGPSRAAACADDGRSRPLSSRRR